MPIKGGAPIVLGGIPERAQSKERRIQHQRATDIFTTGVRRWYLRATAGNRRDAYGIAKGVDPTGKENIGLATTLEQTPPREAYAWASRGDINAFCGLVLDNVSNMILMASMLVGLGFPKDFVLTRMMPGTAIGVLVGDLIFTIMAVLLARRTGRSDVTAMPLGLDTPSVFGMVLLVMGPAFLAAKAQAGVDLNTAARHAWYVGVTMIVVSGLFKMICAPVCGWIRRVVPRAGLLGSLTAIALAIISFMPLIDIVAQPIAGLAALAVILATLTARWELPRRVPGALAALLIGCAVYYGMAIAGLGPGLGAEGGRPPLTMQAALPVPMSDWLSWLEGSWRVALGYLPVAIPLALATVVGGIDCVESAAAVGDEYSTPWVIAVEGFAAVVGGLFGGVIQTTPYIGHPAYKAMGGRAAYTLGTALFVGAVGVFGYFDWIFYLVPKPVVFPIMIFVGLEITAQSFHATEPRHYPAVAFACIPALAYLSLISVNRILPEAKPFAELSVPAQHWIQTMTMLSGGFIVSSLLWASGLAHMIDGKVRAAAGVLVLAGVCAWFGVIHSPLPSSPILWPTQAVAQLKAEGRAKASEWQLPYHWAAAYAAAAAIVVAVGIYGRPPAREPGDARGSH
jgi:AGZA family xanthine/uracil permease-like MFS transporter